MVVDYLSAEGDLPPAAVKIIDKIAYVPDALEKDAKLSLDDLDKYEDEIALIRRVASRVGGMSRLLELRAVLQLPDQFFELEQAITRLSR